MIGFKPPNALQKEVETPRPRRGEHEYEVVRSGRFVRLSILSDDWLLLGFAIFAFLCALLGWSIGQAP